MTEIDRRALLAGTAALLGSGAACGPTAAETPAAAPPAPVARIKVVRDVYFGETLEDPYRWMENDKDPEWLAFLKGQNARTRAILDSIPGRARLLERIKTYSGQSVAVAELQRAGGRLFFQMREPGSDNYKLFVREGAGARTLIDPLARSTGPGHMSLDWWRASPDGSLVAFGLSPNGSENSVLQILRVSDGTVLPERISETEGANPSWLADSSGFFYTQLTGRLDTPERYLDAQARFHRIGSDPALDPVLMRRGLDREVVFDRIQSPAIYAFPGSPFALLALSDVRAERRLHIAPLEAAVAGTARWRPVADFPDEVLDAVLDGEDLYLLTTRGHSRGRVVKTAAGAPDLGTAIEVAPEGRAVIEALAPARDGVYLKLLDGGPSRLALLRREGGLREIALPFEGALGAVAGAPDEPGVAASFSGWLQSPRILEVGADEARDTGLAPKSDIDVRSFETCRGFAEAADGVKIPYTLISKRGAARDGSSPAWISAYGSYGLVAYRPAFAGRLLALVEAGFVVGFANVRGGGEYGRDWHKAGQLMNKPNTWRDLIAVCEHLCAEGRTSKARLAIGGRSAGGITVGRALTERPDLFAAVVDGVGWSNPLRYVAEQNGYGEEPEWGAISDPDGYRALKLIDSYHAVRDGTPYPAVLLTTGVTDPRVAPFHVGKMTARLQKATSSGNPVLLRVDYDAGHGIGSTRSQQDAEAADTYAFLLWRTGARDFTPTRV